MVVAMVAMLATDTDAEEQLLLRVGWRWYSRTHEDIASNL
jgi:hypothetical protein